MKAPSKDEIKRFLRLIKEGTPPTLKKIADDFFLVKKEELDNLREYIEDIPDRVRGRSQFMGYAPNTTNYMRKKEDSAKRNLNRTKLYDFASKTSMVTGLEMYIVGLTTENSTEISLAAMTLIMGSILIKAKGHKFDRKHGQDDTLGPSDDYRMR